MERLTDISSCHKYSDHFKIIRRVDKCSYLKLIIERYVTCSLTHASRMMIGIHFDPGNGCRSAAVGDCLEGGQSS